jgi:diguanylate cyclase (GGDEF)-like protein
MAVMIAGIAWPVLGTLGWAPAPSSSASFYTLLFASAAQIVLSIAALSLHNAARDVARGRQSNLLAQDPLTGLVQRPLALHKLERLLLRSKEIGLSGGVLLVELNNHADILKKHGHGAADNALVVASSRISQQVRAVDTVARVGVNQFLVLMEATFGADEVMDVAVRVRSRGQEHSSELPKMVSLDLHTVLFHLPHTGEGSALAQSEQLMSALEHHLSRIRAGSGRLIQEVTAQMLKEAAALTKMVRVAEQQQAASLADDLPDSKPRTGIVAQAVDELARLKTLMADDADGVRRRAGSNEPTVLEEYLPTVPPTQLDRKKR